MNLRVRPAASLAMVLIFGAYVSGATQLGPQARLMPLLVGIPALVLSLIQFAKDIRQRQEDELVFAAVPRHEIITVVWLLMCVVAIILFGFSWGASAMIAVYFLFATQERWWVAACSAIASYLMFEVALNRGLGAQLFEGLVPPLVMRWM